MNVNDDLYLGSGIGLVATSGENPTAQQGVGPMGRVYVQTFVPKTIQTANIAALQAQTSGVPLVLAAGAGVTTALAPDGSGNTVYVFDVPRCVSLTSVSNLSGGNFTITGYDQYARKITQKLAGPNDNTVNTLKALTSVLSVVPDTTSANTVSIGSSDTFGLNYAIQDIGYCLSVKWNETLAPDAGTLVVADNTQPATNLTGDTRGTYTPSANASNGVRRLVFAQYLAGNQSGPNPALTAVIGVTPA